MGVLPAGTLHKATGQLQKIVATCCLPAASVLQLIDAFLGCAVSREGWREDTGDLRNRCCYATVSHVQV